MKNYKKLTQIEAEELTKYLENKNPKQRDFAKMLGVLNTTVWSWKSKKEYPAFCRPALELIKLKEKVKEII